MTIIEEYYPDWQDAGQSFGEKLVEGLNSQQQSVEDSVNNILGMVSTAQEAQSTLAAAQLSIQEQEQQTAENQARRESLEAIIADIERQISNNEQGIPGVISSLVTQLGLTTSQATDNSILNPLLAEKQAELAALPVFHNGGFIGSPQGAPMDIPIMAQQGEFVMSRDMVQNAMNKGKEIVQHITINSPKWLNPLETAREMNKVNQKLAMGLV